MPDLTNLRNLLKQRGKSEELSKNTGISSGNISDWKSGRSKPGLESLIKIADHFECSIDYLLDRTNEREVNYKLSVQPTIIYRFPVFRQEAAAGVGRLDVSDAYSMEEFAVDNIPDKAVFVMKIAGDSMYNENTKQIKDEAIIVINPKDTLYEDKIVIVNLDGEVVCKRYSIVGDHVEFLSDNVNKQNENKDSRNYREPKVIGVVLGVIENEKFVPVK